MYEVYLITDKSGEECTVQNVCTNETFKSDIDGLRHMQDDGDVILGLDKNNAVTYKSFDAYVNALKLRAKLTGIVDVSYSVKETYNWGNLILSKLPKKYANTLLTKMGKDTFDVILVPPYAQDLELSTLYYIDKVKVLILATDWDEFSQKKRSTASRLQSVVLPDSLTVLGEDIFRGCEELRHIKMPNSLKWIRCGAFMGCSSLECISIPASVKEIEPYAFAFCKQLRSIVIPDAVVGIQDSVFKDCVSLESVQLPSTMCSIGEEAFANCSALTNINIPETVQEIGRKAFVCCTSLTEADLSGVEVIKFSAFNGCTSLKSIKLSDKLEAILKCTFLDCKSLESVFISDSVKRISSQAFGNCIALREVIMSNVLEIGSRVFEGCSNLETLVLPNTLNSIGNMAFCNCSNLRLIKIPKSVVKIGADIFSGCQNVVVLCEPDSTIDLYCKENSISVKYYTVRYSEDVKFEDFMRDVAQVQTGYQGLVSNKTPCDIDNLCAYFCDKYYLSNSVGLSLAKSEKSLREIIEIFDSLNKRQPEEVLL